MTEPLVLLPGMLCDARVFLPQFVALSREMPVTIAPTTDGDRIEEIASALVSTLPAKFALAGQGLGGYVAMELLRRAPERITRVALIGCTPLSDTPQEAAAREPKIVAAKAGRFDDIIREELAHGWLANGPTQKDVQAMITAMAKANGVQAYMRQARMLQRRKDQQAIMRRIKQPALVICGELDGVTTLKRHEFMAEMIPYARLEVVPDAAHVPTLEQPQAMTDILRAWMKQPLVLR